MTGKREKKREEKTDTGRKWNGGVGGGGSTVVIVTDSVDLQHLSALYYHSFTGFLAPNFLSLTYSRPGTTICSNKTTTFTVK